MVQIRPLPRRMAAGLRRPCRARAAPAFRAVAAGLVLAGTACCAAAAVDQPPTKPFPVGQVFTLLFLMLGPFKIVGPFLAATQGADAALSRQIAVRATMLSALALLIAGFLGESILGSFGIPLPVLALSGGIVLFLVALKNVLEQFEQASPQADAAGSLPLPTLRAALAPLAFPTIVTPYGIAALVVFLAYSQTLEGRLVVGALVVAIMLLNMLVMLAAKRLLPLLSLVLPIFGAILGVVQVALGLQIINNALHTLGIL